LLKVVDGGKSPGQESELDPNYDEFWKGLRAATYGKRALAIRVGGHFVGAYGLSVGRNLITSKARSFG
jgi:hypothetical protein